MAWYSTTKNWLLALGVAMPILGTTPSFAQSTTTYTYDLFGRLVTSATTATSLQATYTYDAADNRTALAVTTYVAALKFPPQQCNFHALNQQFGHKILSSVACQDWRVAAISSEMLNRFASDMARQNKSLGYRMPDAKQVAQLSFTNGL